MREPDANANERVLNGVECLGPLPHSALIAEMRRAGIFVSPALYEPFGLSVLEAAASGCTLVLADIPTFRELWNGAAFFVDSRDHAALLAALQTLGSDEPLRDQLQRAARTRARRYSLARMTEAYRDLYSQLQLLPVALSTRPSAAMLELRA
jgi:glycosyltransferase involved in cell wall biosynthesis